jgi:hypothetical protein
VNVTPTTWVFDVDGCLIDSITGTSLRPGTRVLLEHLRSTRCTLLLWSAGGAEYARARAAQQAIDELFHGFHSKEGRDEHGRYSTVALQVSHASTVFVDDRPEDLPIDADVVAVSPYLAHSPHDEGLRLAVIRAGLGSAA